MYSTFLGGSQDENEDFSTALGPALAVDASGNTYVAATTFSNDFPTTTGALATTYLGGPNDDIGLALAVDAAGSAYVAGQAQDGFPTTTGAFQTTNAGGFSDAFITKLSAAGGGGAPMADLVVTTSDAPDPVTVGSNLLYTLTVTNNGPNDATGVMLTNALPTDVIFVSVVSSQGTCNKIEAVICSLGALAHGSNATVTLVVTPAAAGQLTNTATVQANELDPDTTNNSTTAETTVQAPPPPPANGPDLTGAWLSLTQPCKTVRSVQRCTLKGAFEVRNLGDQPAPKSQLQIFLSADDRFDRASDGLLKSITVNMLKPGKTKKKTFSVALPAGSSAAGQFVIAVVDAASVVVETNENNNVKAFRVLP